MWLSTENILVSLQFCAEDFVWKTLELRMNPVSLNTSIFLCQYDESRQFNLQNPRRSHWGYCVANSCPPKYTGRMESYHIKLPGFEVAMECCIIHDTDFPSFLHTWPSHFLSTDKFTIDTIWSVTTVLHSHTMMIEIHRMKIACPTIMKAYLRFGLFYTRWRYKDGDYKYSTPNCVPYCVFLVPWRIYFRIYFCL